MIRQTGPRTFKLYTHYGNRVLGTHSSYESAMRQERAIYASKAGYATRHNPDEYRDIDELVEDLHEFNSSFRKDQLKKSLQWEIDNNPRFIHKNLSGAWGEKWPKIRAFVAREQQKNK